MTEDRDHDRSDDRRDRLTTLLRQADPAVDAPGLGATEAARIRQAIARAADRVSAGGLGAAGWRDWLMPALAAASITAVALGAWLIAGGSFTAGPEVTDAGQTATEPAPAPTGPTPEPIERRAPTAPESARIVAANDPSPPDKRARTVQFTAPRGTRIIWTLDPNFESPIAGQEPRQEQPR